MKDYVLREDVLRCVEEAGHDNELDLGYPDHNEAFQEIIKDIPAADVVEVDVKDLRIKKAIQTLCEFYSTAKKSDYVQKPLAWALYQTWKTFDKMDGGVNDDNNI